MLRASEFALNKHDTAAITVQFGLAGSESVFLLLRSTNTHTPTRSLKRLAKILSNSEYIAILRLSREERIHERTRNNIVQLRWQECIKKECCHPPLFFYNVNFTLFSRMEKGFLTAVKNEMTCFHRFAIANQSLNWESVKMTFSLSK